LIKIEGALLLSVIIAPPAVPMKVIFILKPYNFSLKYKIRIIIVIPIENKDFTIKASQLV
jgi:hypothetical protein